MAEVIPKKNEFGLYEIRIESIGGLGANLAGKILAEAGILFMNLNGASFASYGSEKTGSPIKAFIRFCEGDEEVKSNSPVTEPHLLAVFHENLIKSLPVTQGVGPDATVVVNTPHSPLEMRDMLKLHAGKVCTVDALKIAMEEKVRINTTMLGAIGNASGFIQRDALKDAISDTFKTKYPKLVEPNLKAFDRGWDELVIEDFEPDARYKVIPFEQEKPRLGYVNAPIGGIITDPGNMREKDLSAGRSGYIPIFIEEKCTHCAECHVTCPDFCYVWEKREHKGKMMMFNKGIDYKYCKGCLKCVAICRFEALEKGVEADHDLEKMRVVKYPELEKKVKA